MALQGAVDTVALVGAYKVSTSLSVVDRSPWFEPFFKCSCAPSSEP